METEAIRWYLNSLIKRGKMLKRILYCLLLAPFVILSLAADGPKLQRVIIFETGGKSVSGELTEITPAQVTVKPSPLAKPVTVAWANIQRLSNGMTRQKVVDDWRKNHVELLCDTCHGDGTTDCPTCHGTGVDPAQAKPCEKCNGIGVLGKCVQCKGAKTIPCPNSCLKESSFANVAKGADGKRWLHLHKGAFTIDVSDAHIGQVVSLKNGQPDISVCPVCGGKSLITCPTCHGTGDQACATCHGTGKIGPPCPDCKAGKVECKDCNGTGLKPTK